MSLRLLPGIAALLVVAVAAPAAADCGMGAPPQHVDGYRGIAFVGRVTKTEPVPAGRDDYILLTFDIERRISGTEDDTITLVAGTTGNCAYFWGDMFQVGDRVLVAFRPVKVPVAFPVEAPVADVALLYRPTDDGWRFARGAVLHPELFPDWAREASSLPEILALLDPGALPDTATATGDDPAPVFPFGLLFAGTLAAAAVGLRRRVTG